MGRRESLFESDGRPACKPLQVLQIVSLDMVQEVRLPLVTLDK